MGVLDYAHDLSGRAVHGHCAPDRVLPGPYRSAVVSVTMATSVSLSVNMRPRTIGMPINEKYSGDTMFTSTTCVLARPQGETSSGCGRGSTESSHLGDAFDTGKRPMRSATAHETP